jgi:hypothetical protein
MATLRLAYRPSSAGHVVELALEREGCRWTARASLAFDLTKQDREDVRWYLEDYLQYPMDPAPLIASRVEQLLTSLGTRLFDQVFGSPDAAALWDEVAGALPGSRVEVAAGSGSGAAIPWELLRDPATDGPVALQAAAFVRSPSQAEPRATAVAAPGPGGGLRVLLVICRPGGSTDVPFRSVASRLVRLSSGAREAFELDVLRPPTFTMLAETLEGARAAGSPYHVVPRGAFRRSRRLPG